MLSLELQLIPKTLQNKMGMPVSSRFKSMKATINKFILTNSEFIYFISPVNKCTVHQYMCDVLLSCTVWCIIILCCAVYYCPVLCCVLLSCAGQCIIVLCCALLSCAVQYIIVQCCVAMTLYLWG